MVSFASMDDFHAALNQWQAAQQENLRVMIDQRVIEGFASEQFRASLEERIKPEIDRARDDAKVSLQNMAKEVTKVMDIQNAMTAAIADVDNAIAKMRESGDRVFKEFEKKSGAQRQSLESEVGRADAKIQEITTAMSVALQNLQDKVASAQTQAEQQVNQAGHKIVTHVNDQLDRIRKEIQAAGNIGGGGGGGNQGGKGTGKLVPPKECPVGKLSDDPKVSEFKHWAKQVEGFLEGHSSWTGAAKVLRSTRRHPEIVDKLEFDKIVVAVNSPDDGSEPPLIWNDWIFSGKAAELHRFLFSRLGPKLGGKVGMPDDNGFELWRLLHREVDPAHPEEGRAIVSRMRELFTGPAATTEALWSLISWMTSTLRS